eukprot:5389478-Amphidinium_carterae.2
MNPGPPHADPPPGEPRHRVGRKQPLRNFHAQAPFDTKVVRDMVPMPASCQGVGIDPLRADWPCHGVVPAPGAAASSTTFRPTLLQPECDCPTHAPPAAHVMTKHPRAYVPVPDPREAADEGLRISTAEARALARTAKHMGVCKAFRMLQSHGVAAQTEQNFGKAWIKLNPREDDPLVLDDDDKYSPWSPSEKDLTTAVHRLKTGRAADAGGWTTEMLQLAWKHPLVQTALAAWICQISRPHSPAWARHCMGISKVVLLNKDPQGDGIRPILLVPI